MHPHHRSFRRRALAVSLFCCVFPAFPAVADDAAANLDQIVVTATRTAQTQDQTLAAVTVIDRDEIQRLQPASLPDLLTGRAGISIANNGGPGKSTSLFLRGTESDHVLILVDGMKIGSATSGGAALQDIPPEQIERVEIVRGPFSSLYGSEAIGGVIQIFTRRPQGAFSPTATAAIGSQSTQRFAAGVSGRANGTHEGWYAINAAHEDTDGINAYRGTRNFDPDKDGYRNDSLTLQGGMRLGERWDADLHAFRAEGRNEYDGSANNEADTVQQVVGGRVRYAPGERVKVTASLGTSADLSENFLDGAYSSTFDTRRELGSVQADVGVASGLLTFGFDWLGDDVRSNTDYERDRRINRGAFGQWQQAFGTQSLQASVRRDDDSQFGGKTTGSVLWGWDFAEALRLGASYGTAFKAPTFNELYFPGYGNPALGPETSRSTELSLRGQHRWGTWSLNAFETKIDDLIAFDASLGDMGGPNNIDRARIRGLEAVAGVTWAEWNVRTSLTWLDPVNDDTASRGNVLPRRAKQSGRIDADRRFDRLSVGASVSGAGARYDNLANTTRMGGYGLADFRVGYALTDAWNVQASLRNAFDKRYETAALYNQPGRTWLLTVRYQPVAR